MVFIQVKRRCGDLMSEEEIVKRMLHNLVSNNENSNILASSLYRERIDVRLQKDLDFDEILKLRMKEFNSYRELVDLLYIAIDELKEYLENKFNTKVRTEIKPTRFNIVVYIKETFINSDERRVIRDLYTSIGRKELQAKRVFFGNDKNGAYVKYAFY